MNYIEAGLFYPNVWLLNSLLVDNYTSEELGIDVSPRVRQIKVIEPPKREKGIMVADVADLVQKLKHEAKVIWNEHPSFSWTQ